MIEGIIYDQSVERRERIRFKAKANCSFGFFDASPCNNEYNVCKVENIGTGGLAFLCDHKCKLNDRLLLTIALKDYYTEEPINAVGEVIWTKCSKFPEKYCIGVKFVNMLEDDLLNLTRTLH